MAGDDSSRIADLLSRWEELRSQGHVVSAAELCRDCPELAEELVRRIQALELANRRFAFLTVSSGPQPAPAPPALNQFLQTLIESRVMSAGEVRDFVGGLPAEGKQDAGAVCQALMAANRLTGYQAAELLQGHCGSLVLGEYLILDRIGVGGMGAVLKARHRRMNRLVALKVIAPTFTKSPAIVQRFYREIEAVAKLSHPNVVTAHDAGEHEGIHYLVMELVEGRDLAREVERRGPLPVAEALTYLLQAARGLAHAHGRGVIHRDVKPANLFVDGEGTVKVLDLGLARFRQAVSEEHQACRRTTLTQTGEVMGTVDYLAPEQALRAKDSDQRADIYSLGCTLHFLLTGRPAVVGATAAEKLLWHQLGPIPSLRQMRGEVPVQVDAVFQRMLARRPEDRYQSMPEVIQALEACPEARQWRGVGPESRRRRWLLGAVAAAFTVLITVLATTEWPFEEEPSLSGDQAAARKDQSPSPPLRPRPKQRRRPSRPVAEDHKPPPARAEFKPFINSISMKLVPIPAGEFMMGSPDWDQDASSREKPQHHVKITRPFYLGACEVTQKQYKAVMGENPSWYDESNLGEDTDNHPVESISWESAVRFCRKLSELPEERRAGRIYRLPTEAEWEYACRARTSTRYHSGDDNQSLSKVRHFVGERPPKTTMPVGELRPNKFGLYDMHGNVREWVADWYGPFTAEDQVDPKGPPEGRRHVVRGGCYHYRVEDGRSAARFQVNSESAANIGFRVALTP